MKIYILNIQSGNIINQLGKVPVSNLLPLKNIMVHLRPNNVSSEANTDLGTITINFGYNSEYFQEYIDKLLSIEGGIDKNAKIDLIKSENMIFPMYLYQLGFYGKPCEYNENQPWFDKANKYLKEDTVPNEWNLTFNSINDQQPELMYDKSTYFTQPLRLVEKITNGRFYMEIDVIDDNIDIFNSNITKDDWDDKYVIDIGIGDFNRGTIGNNNEFALIESVNNAFEMWIGRMGVGNAYLGGNYYHCVDETETDIEEAIDNIPDFKFNDNPISTNTKFTIGIGIAENYCSIFTDSSGAWTEYKSNTNDNIELIQSENSKIGIMLYSETLNGENIKDYLDHLKIVVRFKNFIHQESADKIYNNMI